MAHADWLYAPLTCGAIYEYKGMLLQAWQSDWTWRLMIITEDGCLLEPSQGLLFGYELAMDLSGWQRLHYFTMPLLWPSWHVIPNGMVEIQPSALNLVAESTEAFVPRQQAENEVFRELMAEFEWE